MILISNKTLSRYVVDTSRICALLLSVISTGVYCAENMESYENCAKMSDKVERLTCYDRAAGRTVTPEAEEFITFGALDRNVSLLDQRWELSSATQNPKYTFQSYKPVYIMPIVGINHINTMPCSVGGDPGNCVTEANGMEGTEVKFQLSFKVKVGEGVFDNYGDIWMSYTQSSRWQLYNDALSAPFRETNYEPEMMLMFPVKFRLGNWQLPVLGLGFNHQSNGRNDPLSRSWNRITAYAAIEQNDWVVVLTPWYRIPENTSDDDNPDIEDYVGRAELMINKYSSGQTFSMSLRHSLRTDESRGSMTLEWTYPASGYLEMYMQIFTGYGESLVDYNHKQTSIGLGISLVHW